MRINIQFRQNLEKRVLQQVAEGRRDFLTREPVSGDLLSQRLRKGVRADEALRLAVEVGNAIGRVHAQGRVHGGLCPFCIIVTATGVTLTDPPSSPVDRAAYQSPEEFNGARPDVRSDVFAYGALLTGAGAEAERR